MHQVYHTEVEQYSCGLLRHSGRDFFRGPLEIITVFSARLYGSRSRKNKQVLDALKAAANEVAGS